MKAPSNSCAAQCKTKQALTSMEAKVNEQQTSNANSNPRSHSSYLPPRSLSPEETNRLDRPTNFPVVVQSNEGRPPATKISKLFKSSCVDAIEIPAIDRRGSRNKIAARRGAGLS